MTCTLIYIISTGYNAAVLCYCWFLFILWWGYWFVNTSLSDKKSVYSKSLILRWSLRPTGLLFTLFWQFYVHIEQGLKHMVWKSYTSKQKVDMLRLSKRSIKRDEKRNFVSGKSSSPKSKEEGHKLMSFIELVEFWNIFKKATSSTGRPRTLFVSPQAERQKSKELYIINHPPTTRHDPVLKWVILNWMARDKYQLPIKWLNAI